ncbi:MAG: hypothetical protein KKA73_21560 [Chloroflexi bacterium]|nr:hypothetical protein [Chloroflexota bacterium]MBU1750282.1 hypothetical protein [Chloroflexota bacterium]
MLTRAYVGVQTRVATMRSRIAQAARDERGDLMLEYLVGAALILAVLGVGLLLIANAANAQGGAVEGGINAIPVTDFNP